MSKQSPRVLSSNVYIIYAGFFQACNKQMKWLASEKNAPCDSVEMDLI